MAWIESHQALEKHPKVLQLSKACGWGIPETIGKLHIFWWWCLDYAPDGRLDKFDHETIASVFGVHEGATNLVHALLKLNWLDSEPSIRVHDWWDYAGRFLQVRYKRTPKIWKEIKRFYGHSIQRTNNRTTTEQQPTNNHKPNQPNLTNQDLTKPNQPSIIPASAKAERSPTKTSEVWSDYRAAYHDRYQVDPVRNMQVNGMLSRLVDKLGREEAPQVAAFYLRHNNPFYVQKRHPVNLLLQDAEGLRTQWATGIKATTNEARNIETQDNMREQNKRVMKLLNQGGEV